MRARPVTTALLALILCPLEAMAQQDNPVYVDDSPQAWMLFQQAQDQTRDNLSEAVRIYQDLLTEYALKLIPFDKLTRDHFASVHWKVLREIRSDDLLLERYRRMETAAAERLLQAGHLEKVARGYSLTAPGLEALLRLGQRDLEAGWFNSAIKWLEEATEHPDLDGQYAAQCWHMIGIAAHYLDDPQRRTEAAQKLEGGDQISQTHLAHLKQLIKQPKGPGIIIGISPLDTTHAAELTGLIAEDIWTMDLTSSLLNRRYQSRSNNSPDNNAARELRRRSGTLNTAAPTIAGEIAYVNEGHVVHALDRYTGRPVWSQPFIDPDFANPEDMNNDQTFDMNMITVRGDSLVTLTGHLLLRHRSNKGKVVCLDAITGEFRWSRDISHIDQTDEFEKLFPHGQPIIAEGLVFIMARKARKQQLTASYVIALDLNTGAMRWAQHLSTSGGIRGSARPFSSLTYKDGSLYAATPLGSMCRIETSTGEIRWLRRFDVPINTNLASMHRAWEFDRPVVTQDRVIAIQPNRRRIAVLNREDGSLLATHPCVSSNGWGSPNYLLANEHSVYAVGRDISAFQLDNLEFPVWRLHAPFQENADTGRPLLEDRYEIRGRVQLAGGNLVVPTHVGILIVDDETGRIRQKLQVNTIGNPVAVDSQILLASGERLNSYMSFSRAEEMLRTRIASSPENPDPALSLLKLGMRVRKFALSLEAAHLAFDAMNNAAYDENVERAHSELFARLLDMQKRKIPTTRADGEALFAFVNSIADSPDRRIEYLLAYGKWLGGHAPQMAIENGYQAILSDPKLANRPRSLDGEVRSASDWALHEQRQLILAHGPDIYSPQSDFADFRLSQNPDGSDPDPEELRSLILEFPFADSVVATAIKAAALYQNQGKLHNALGVLASVFHNLDTPVRQAEILGKYVELCLAQGWETEAIATLRQANRIMPNLRFTSEGNPRTSQQWIASLGFDAGPQWRPEIGVPTGEAIFMEGSLVRTLKSAQTPWLRDRVLLRNDDEYLMFKPPNTTPLWTTILDDSPADILVANEKDLLLWFGQGNEINHPQAIMLDADTGEIRWISPDINEHLNAPVRNLNQVKASRNQMPNERPFDPRRTIPLFGRNVFVLVQRTGGVMALNPEDGTTVLWTNQHTLNEVHLARLEDYGLVLAGMTYRSDALGGTIGKIPAILVLDPKSGEIRRRMTPMSRAGVRWMQTSPLGQLIYGTAAGIVMVDLLNNQQIWANTSGGARNTVSATLHRDHFLLRDRDSRIRTIDRVDGHLSAQFPVAFRRDSIPIDLRELVVDEDGVIARYRNKIVNYSHKGAQIGAEAITGTLDYKWIFSTSDRNLLINAKPPTQQLRKGEPRARRSMQYIYEIHTLSKNGKTMHQSFQLQELRRSLQSASLIDGWLIVSTVDSTFAISIPPER